MEQQLAPVVHAAPPAAQAGVGGGAQVFAPVAPEQVPLQHSLATVHVVPFATHWLCGSAQ